MFRIFRLKKGIVHFRASMKIIVLIGISILLVTGAILLFYKPTYTVSYNGEFLGYVTSKSQLQSKINEFIKENYTDTKFVILLYDDVTNSDNDDVNDNTIATLQPNYWQDLQDNGAIVISTKELVSDVLYNPNYQLTTDTYQFMRPHHPNAKAWELIVPALTKKLDL